MTPWGCTVTDLTVGWQRGERAILHEVSLNLAAEAHTALPLMGLSGAGKSTLLYVLAALKWPQTGRVEWRFPDHRTVEWGREGLPSPEAESLRRKYFGFAFQDSTLIPHLRVVENLAYPLVFLGSSWSEAREEARCALHEVLQDQEHPEEEHLLSRFPHQLSGGQRQRVALAQALIHNPAVVFADEPAGNLDLATRKKVMAVLRRWLDEDPSHRLLLWVTHHSDDPELMDAEEILWVEDTEVCPVDLEWLSVWDQRVRRGSFP